MSKGGGPENYPMPIRHQSLGDTAVAQEVDVCVDDWQVIVGADNLEFQVSRVRTWLM